MNKLISFTTFIIINSILINFIINFFPNYNKKIHPLIIGTTVIILTITSSIFISINNNSSIIAYITFLIVIGGLIIIFLYFTRFINNLKIIIKWKFYLILPVKFIIVIIIIIILIYHSNTLISWINNSEIKIINKLNSYEYINSNINSIYIYNINKNFFTLICIIYLFLALTFLAKIYINKKISIRKIN